MSSRGRSNPKDMAEKQYKDANLWRIALAKTVRRWRSQALYYVAQTYLTERVKARRLPVITIVRYQNESDRAHDLLLSTADNIRSLARAATACDLAGRIYDENAEDRAWAEDQGGRDGNYGN